MKIYVSSSVTSKQDEYVDFLVKSCNYNLDEAETRRWEVEYRINQYCNPISMKPGNRGTIKFRSALQRQEIERFGNNRLKLSSILKRRKGNKGNTCWNVNYVVSTNGDVFIIAIKCYNTYSKLGENRQITEHNKKVVIKESQLHRIIRETLRRVLLTA